MDEVHLVDALERNDIFTTCFPNTGDLFQMWNTDRITAAVAERQQSVAVALFFIKLSFSRAGEAWRKINMYLERRSSAHEAQKRLQQLGAYPSTAADAAHGKAAHSDLLDAACRESSEIVFYTVAPDMYFTELQKIRNLCRGRRCGDDKIFTAIQCIHGLRLRWRISPHVLNDQSPFFLPGLQKQLYQHAPEIMYNLAAYALACRLAADEAGAAMDGASPIATD
jgi:hypothetical protein